MSGVISISSDEEETVQPTSFSSKRTHENVTILEDDSPIKRKKAVDKLIETKSIRENDMEMVSILSSDEDEKDFETNCISQTDKHTIEKSILPVVLSDEDETTEQVKTRRIQPTLIIDKNVNSTSTSNKENNYTFSNNETVSDKKTEIAVNKNDTSNKLDIEVNIEASSSGNKIEPANFESSSDDSYNKLVTCINKNMEQLIEYCKENLTSKKMGETLEKTIALAHNVLAVVISQKKDLIGLNDNLIAKNALLANNPKQAIIFFNEIFMEIKSLKEMEVPDASKSKRLKKLWKALYKCEKKIKLLETAEIDFDNEEDSVYIQEGRYKERAAEIYKCICKLTNQDSRSISLLHSRLDFDKSKHIEINKALNKKFTNNSKFPDYLEVHKCIKRCVDKNILKLTPREIDYEAKFCFTEIGKMLQKRRQRDFNINICLIATENNDPAECDPELNEKLKDSQNNLEAKVDALCDRYCRLQETGVDPNVSNDSSDSNFVDSDDSD